MITTKNRIGYIQRRYDENNVPHFKFIVSKIKRVNIGVKSTTQFYAHSIMRIFPLNLPTRKSLKQLKNS